MLNRHDLLRHVSGVLGVLGSVRDPGCRQGCWSVLIASMTACLMVWSPAPALLDRFAEAMACLGRAVPAARLGRAYNGLFKALARQWRWAEGPLKSELRRRALGLMDRVGGWRVLAVDGSKVELPRTRAHRRVFGIADNGVFPQAFVTAIVHAATGLVWDWRIGPGRSSERAHLARMIPDLPAGALLLMDGYYVGYELWTALIENGTHWMMRVGANVRLISGLFPGRVTIDRRAGIVYVLRNNAPVGERPLRLRLIRIGGRSTGVYLLTTVLDATRLSRAQAGVLYRMRWGVEVFYRSVKQIMGAAKMMSRTPRRARLELNWTMTAAAVLTVICVSALRHRRADPGRWSFAGALRVVRAGLREDLAGRGRRRRSIAARLGDALKDNACRKSRKRSRHRPKTTITPKPTSPPVLINATARLCKRAANTTPIALAA